MIPVRVEAERSTRNAVSEGHDLGEEEKMEGLWSYDSGSSTEERH